MDKLGKNTKELKMNCSLSIQFIKFSIQFNSIPLIFSNFPIQFNSIHFFDKNELIQFNSTQFNSSEQHWWTGWMSLSNRMSDGSTVSALLYQ